MTKASCALSISNTSFSISNNKRRHNKHEKLYLEQLHLPLIFFFFQTRYSEQFKLQAQLNNGFISWKTICALLWNKPFIQNDSSLLKNKCNQNRQKLSIFETASLVQRGILMSMVNSLQYWTPSTASDAWCHDSTCHITWQWALACTTMQSEEFTSRRHHHLNLVLTMACFAACG